MTILLLQGFSGPDESIDYRLREKEFGVIVYIGDIFSFRANNYLAKGSGLKAVYPGPCALCHAPTCKSPSRKTMT